MTFTIADTCFAAG